MEIKRNSSQKSRMWVLVLIALLAGGLLAALLASLGWQRPARAEVDTVTVGFLTYAHSSEEYDCGPEKTQDIAVFRNGPSPTGDILVYYSVLEGGNPLATAGLDFVPVTTGTLVLDNSNDQDHPAYIPVTIICDQIDEPNEQFHVVLLGSEPSENVIVNNSPVVVTITDDDTPEATINDLIIDEGALQAELTVSLSPVPWQTVELQYNTVPGSATFDDFVNQSDGVLNIPAGAATVPLRVAIIDDPIDETNDLEQFTVALSSADTNAISVTPGTSGTITIRDNDEAGFNIEPSQIIMQEGTTSIFTVTLDTQPENAVTFAITQTLPLESRIEILTDTLTFDSNNWSDGLPVAVSSPVDNPFPVFTERYDVHVNPINSLDLAYNGLDSQTIQVVLQDDDFRYCYMPRALRESRPILEFFDNFDQPESINLWTLLNGEAEWQAGRYVLKQLQPGFNTRSIAPVLDIRVDYSASVKVRIPQDADPYTRVGIFFDYLSNRQFYRFMVRPATSEYILEVYDNGYIPLAYGTSPAINGGHDENELRLERRSNEIWLYVNNFLITAGPIIDHTYRNGRAGLVILAPTEFINTPLAAGSFDNFSLLELDD